MAKRCEHLQLIYWWKISFTDKTNGAPFSLHLQRQVGLFSLKFCMLNSFRHEFSSFLKFTKTTWWHTHTRCSVLLNIILYFQNNTGEHFRSPRRNMRSSIDGQSDESETSSVCSERSERSFDSFKRPCDVSMIHNSYKCVHW